MSYYFAKTIEAGDIDAAQERVKEALQEKGFGILTVIDLQVALKDKLGADFRPYRILGACNPKLAYKALQSEDKIGTMLPCNVIIQQAGADAFEVAAVDPVASMQAIENEALSEIAAGVRDKLEAVIAAL
ncbi:DUF302 domain-containing protein [Novosphingobium pentaromativorans]|uniref:DUF302 domain-containing protein n=1 Tax=Novosphingobium pentaromativorans TaxID=205844 RepID=UPI0002F43A21|nr:DUF302 domain-containing protein [Novosphingobium pentaromativorans]AIT79180.1 hypothetical protein JI59_04920 [Novosphingobium pentaromativorans US6-1]